MVRSPGAMRSKPKNTARGTPGNRHSVATTACALQFFRAQGHGAFGAPAFRAPSSFSRECGMEVGLQADPAPAKKTRDAQRWLFFTLPCRGRVARRSEAQARRGGAVPQAPISRKEGPPPGLAALAHP